MVPPTPSWGNILADAMAYYKVAWWFVFFPGAALLTTTLAFNVLGDSVRDALDPRPRSVRRASAARSRVILFLLRRLAWSALVVWVVATAVFVIYFAVPRDVARLIAGSRASEQTLAIVRARLGLDQPVGVQYLRFLRRLARGDLGESFLTQEPVTAIIARDFPVTASLALGSGVLWLVVGVVAGVVAATRRRSRTDRAITAIALGFYSMPTFLLGQLLLFFLFFQLYMAGFEFFPPGSYVAFSDSPLQWARFLVLPWLSIALVSAATYSRLTRSAMLDVLAEDYIRTARAKGLTERRIIYRHALRSSLTPVVSQLGVDVGALLGGAIVTEVVFGLPASAAKRCRPSRRRICR